MSQGRTRDGSSPLRGEERDQVKTALKKWYEDDKLSIADCAQKIKRSYSTTRVLLDEAGVTFRPVGGNASQARAARTAKAAARRAV